MDDKKMTPSEGLELKEAPANYAKRGLHWVGFGKCTDRVVVVPDGVRYIGYKEESRYEYDNFDTQHSRGGWAVYHVPTRLVIPSFVEEIHIPASVTSISDKAFDLISPKVRLFVDKDNSFYDVMDNKIIDKKR